MLLFHPSVDSLARVIPHALPDGYAGEPQLYLAAPFGPIAYSAPLSP